MSLLRCGFSLLAFLFCVSAIQADPPPVRIVYFVPTDRTPCKDYEARLDRVMNNVREFYLKGMKENGLGEKTFSLERTGDGKLKIYIVEAKGPMSDYGRNDASKVRAEVKNAMRTKFNINIDRETIVIFQLLLKWEGDKAVELGPYVGGGSSLSGTAWVYDDDLLDPDSLKSKEKGGYYHGYCSIGKFNSHYIGGIAHELGHAFSLPHDCELLSEKSKGASLMGGGNHTYGTDLRGEGNGSFLSASSAYRLRNIRAFAGDVPDATKSPSWEISDLSIKSEKGKILIDGTVSGTPGISAVIAYNDAEGGDDYDALSWTLPLNAKPGEKLRFNFPLDQLKPGKWQLRLLGVHENGRTSQLAYDYSVSKDGIADVEELMIAAPLGTLAQAFFARNESKIKEVSEKLLIEYPKNETVIRKISIVKSLRNPVDPLAPAEIPGETKSIAVSKLRFEKTTTGWGPMQRDSVPETLFLEVGGKTYDNGLFVHAPSACLLNCEAKWKTFKSGFGLIDGRSGSVVFVVRGDGKELFRSKKIQEPNSKGECEIDITGVNKLELISEDAGDGKNFDWSCWLEPTLER